MKTCYELTIPGQYPIKLEQYAGVKALFRVTYGADKRSNLTYAQACRDLGAVILHALACNGDINNDGE